jgi:hypothetical protein
MRGRGERDGRVDDIEATMSMNSAESRQMSILLQLTLFLIMTVTLILAIWVRLTGAGWFIILWGIPLLILAILHFGFQVTAIRKASKMKPSYILLMLLSNLFLFLGFALQVDAGDGPGSYLAIVVFYHKYLKHSYANPVPQGQFSFYLYTNIAFLIALIVSWFFLLGTSFRKQEKNA